MMLWGRPKAIVGWDGGKAVAVRQLPPVEVEIFRIGNVVYVVLVQLRSNIMIDFDIGQVGLV